MSIAPYETTLADPIELHFEESASRVRVTTRDNSLLLLSVEEAISACRAFKTQLEFKSQFDHLLNHLWMWLKAHRESVFQAFLTTRDAGLLFLLVTHGYERNHSFESDLTELDTEVANDAQYQLIDLSVLAIPNCPRESVHSFLSRKMALRFVFDGDGK